MTNADAIRKMSDSELNDALLDIQCQRCDYYGTCKDVTYCHDKIGAWLLKNTDWRKKGK